jgi:hypothetical protein
MFPDIDGLAQQLAWRYWVMDERVDARYGQTDEPGVAREKRRAFPNSSNVMGRA